MAFHWPHREGLACGLEGLGNILLRMPPHVDIVHGAREQCQHDQRCWALCANLAWTTPPNYETDETARDQGLCNLVSNGAAGNRCGALRAKVCLVGMRGRSILEVSNQRPGLSGRLLAPSRLIRWLRHCLARGM